MTQTYLLVGDSGEPLGVVDVDRINADATRFAFALAACCDDTEALDRVQTETLYRVGAKNFGYVAAGALRTLAEHVHSPALEVAEAHGTDLRAGLRAIAEGRDPAGGEAL